MPTLTETLHEQCRAIIAQRGMFTEDLLAALRAIADRPDGMLSELMEQYGGMQALLNGAWPGPLFQADVSAANLRAAMDSVAAYGTGGWLLPGTAGARMNPSARASRAMARQQDGSWRVARENLVPNSTQVGAAIGVFPTGWTNVVAAGLTWSITATGIDGGVPWADWTLAGTAGATSGCSIIWTPLNAIGVTPGQRYTASVMPRVVGGSLTGISQTRIAIEERSTVVVNTQLSVITMQDGGALDTARRSLTGTIANAAATSIRSYLILTPVNGATINITVRVAQPEVYLGDPRDGIMPTSGTAAYGPAIDWDDTLGDWVVRCEPQATNEIRNAAGVGAAVGGAAPANWALGAQVGLTASIDALGTDAATGMPFVRVRFQGQATSNPYSWTFEAFTQIAALVGETWAWSAWLQYIGSGRPNNLTMRISERSAAGASLAAIDTLVSPDEGAPTRVSSVGVLTNASTAFVTPTLRIGLTVGQTYDFTIQVACPQLERNRLSSPIITWGTAATRAEDRPFGTYTGTAAGAMVVEARTTDLTSGAIRALCALDDGSTNNRIALRLAASGGVGGQGEVIVTNGGVDQAQLGLDGTPAATRLKLGVAWAANDVRASRNGASIGTPAVSATIPSTTTFRLGHTAGGGNSLNGGVRRLLVVSPEINTSLLNSLTA